MWVSAGLVMSSFLKDGENPAPETPQAGSSGGGMKTAAARLAGALLLPSKCSGRPLFQPEVLQLAASAARRASSAFLRDASSAASDSGVTSPV